MGLRNHAYALALRLTLTASNSRRDDQAYYRLLAHILGKLGLKSDGKTVTDHYLESDVEDKTIMLVGLGSSVRGNLFYLLKELNESNRFTGYRIYVRTLPETDEYVRDLIASQQWHRTTTVPDLTQYDQLLANTKYLLTEVNMPTSWAKKPDQVYINIWHGTPLKHLGCDKHARNSHRSGVKQRDFISADYLLYPNYYTRKHMGEAYRVGNLMQGSAVMLGYPRTGGMLQTMADPAQVAALRSQLAPQGETVFAYMPTWKDYLDSDQVIDECLDLLRYLDTCLSDTQLLYVNLHHKIGDSVDYAQFTHVRKFPAHLDTYQLLAVTDTLITDYSSVFFDYGASQRPIILYCPDLELYRKKRGLYLDIETLPLDIAHTKEEVAAALARNLTGGNCTMAETFCAFDSPANARKLCSLFLDHPDPDVVIEPLKNHEEQAVMVFTEQCDRSAQTDLLQELVTVHRNADYELYIGCDKEAVSRNRKSAYPLLSDIPVIGIHSEMRLSIVGKKIRQLIEMHELSFSQGMRYLHHEYHLAAQRLWGQRPFSLIVALDVRDPDLLLTLALEGSPFVLYATDELLGILAGGSSQLSSSIVRFCLERSEGILVADQSALELLHCQGIRVPGHIVSSSTKLEEFVLATVNRHRQS